jgi:hypothetical protein
MQSPSLLFAGVDISSGRTPITFAALDEDLNIMVLENRDVSAALSYLREHQNIVLVINVPSSKMGRSAFEEFKNQISRAGFKTFSKKDHTQQWFETKVQDCYREWIGENPLPRRTLEGRLQRVLVLYEQGLRIKDPMDMFEEITRYKLIHGLFKLEDIYSSKELDALGAAYMAWISVNHPGRVVVQGEFVLTAQE